MDFWKRHHRILLDILIKSIYSAISGAIEMAHWLRALSGLVGDHSLVPRTPCWGINPKDSLLRKKLINSHIQLLNMGTTMTLTDPVAFFILSSWKDSSILCSPCGSLFCLSHYSPSLTILNLQANVYLSIEKYAIITCKIILFYQLFYIIFFYFIYLDKWIS